MIPGFVRFTGVRRTSMKRTLCGPRAPPGHPFFGPEGPQKRKKKNETGPGASNPLLIGFGRGLVALVSEAWVPGGEDYRSGGNRRTEPGNRTVTETR